LEIFKSEVHARVRYADLSNISETNAQKCSLPFQQNYQS